MRRADGLARVVLRNSNCAWASILPGAAYAPIDRWPVHPWTAADSDRISDNNLGECDMAKNKPGLIGTLVAVGALGATAGMLAWRFAQRHRMQRQTFHRELNRWEGEGGSLAESCALPNAAAAGDAMAAGAMARAEPVNGATDASSGAWPFPQSGSDPATRH
jgi:hypothetical protein